jgi:predicted outer membrane repeat protein
VSGNTGVNSGAGIGNYGGALTLTNSSVDHNSGGSGAGIFNDSGFEDATLTITNSSVSFNHAAHDDDFFGGGGIFNFAENGNTASLVATGLTMIGDTKLGGHGGAIGNGSLDSAAVAVATISQSRIGPPNGKDPNQAIFGGGISNDGRFGPASLTLQPGTIVAHNQATNDGGGVYSTGAQASLSIAPGVVFLANTPDDVS